MYINEKKNKTFDLLVYEKNIHLNYMALNLWGEIL